MIQTVSFYSHELLLGMVDLPTYQPTTAEIEVWMEADDVVKTLVASAPFSKVAVGGRGKAGKELTGPPGYSMFKAHGVAYRWMELEGPFLDAWPPRSHQRLFGTLPLKMEQSAPTIEKPKKGKKKTQPALT